MMEKTYPIVIGALESLYLSDAVSMFTPGPPMAAAGESSVFPRLIIKIGVCVLYTEANKATSVTLGLTEDELWVVRELAKSSVYVSSEKVGLKLLVKVFEHLVPMHPDLLPSKPEEAVELTGPMADALSELDYEVD